MGEIATLGIGSLLLQSIFIFSSIKWMLALSDDYGYYLRIFEADFVIRILVSVLVYVSVSFLFVFVATLT